jgi:hypothetical protein
MRIKSYFAPSVQAAIALARKEFGDGVTLVTSHVAAPENRGAGEYEVVFAIDEQPANTAAPLEEVPRETKSETPAFSAFQDLLLQAVATRPSTEERVPEKLAHIRGCLIEIGLPSAAVLQVMSLVEQSLGIGQTDNTSQFLPVHSSPEEQSLSEAALPIHSSFEVVPSLEKQPDIVSLLQVTQESVVSVPQFGPTAAELLFAESVAKPPAFGRTPL